MSDKPEERGAATIKLLRQGKLPQMVDWFDPVLLGVVGVRTLLSSTIGQYADQRPMQAAMDVTAPEALAIRHDYSDPSIPRHAADPMMKLDQDGRLWVDFIADLGDGFEATYAMAYLMAGDALTVPDDNGKLHTLPAGEMLILGGDLAYPNATIKEYQDRCIMPYDMAFQTEKPRRKLFFIAGNHDWYDGLTAFTSVFCTARGRYSEGVGKQIGGWRCHQQRSYFATKLPYDWWVWGIDTALSDTIDDAQLDYFHTMSEATRPGDRVIILTHAPGWINNRNDSLHEIAMLARARGAEVVAVIAGDLHHYSRYYSEKLGVHLITSGGGGAFAHATHQLKTRLTVEWPVPTEATRRVSDAKDRVEFNHLEKEAVRETDQIDFTEKQIEVTAKPSPRTDKPLTETYQFQAPNFYPSKLRSRLLTLRNLWLPFHNRKFAVLLGAVYLIYAWMFQLSVADPSESFRKAQYLHADQECIFEKKQAIVQNSVALDIAEKGFTECKKKHYATIDRTVEKAQAFETTKTTGARRAMADAGLSSTKEQTDAALSEFKEAASRAWIDLFTSISPKRVLFGMLDNPTFFFMVVGLWIGLVIYVQRVFRNSFANWTLKIGIGTIHFCAHMALLLMTNAILNALVYEPFVNATKSLSTVVIGVSIYTALMMLIGGLFGGLVLGLYWVLTSQVFGMNMDAFSALGIRNYKNFLRMSFERDKVTIYPVGLDTVPGRRGWRAPETGETLPGHNPRILPKKPLKPHLIEQPIVIDRHTSPSSLERDLAGSIRGRT